MAGAARLLVAGRRLVVVRVFAKKIRATPAADVALALRWMKGTGR